MVFLLLLRPICHLLSVLKTFFAQNFRPDSACVYSAALSMPMPSRVIHKQFRDPERDCQEAPEGITE
jgi:hypothetical protein